MLDELDEYATGAARMYECDVVAVRARARGWVDQVEPPAGQVVEGGLDIIDAIGDMVEAGATFLKKPCNGAIGGEWLDQLEGGVA